jgi:hypothetical protein
MLLPSVAGPAASRDRRCYKLWPALLPAACNAASDHACVFSSNGDGAAMRGSCAASELLSKGGDAGRGGCRCCQRLEAGDVVLVLPARHLGGGGIDAT